MRLSRITVSNFRNLANVDISLTAGTVIVGENRAGKSNLMHALRLVLDAGLSQSDRQLDTSDFWDGLRPASEKIEEAREPGSKEPDADHDRDTYDPMSERHEIRVSVELADFSDDPRLVSTLNEALLQFDPLRARLTYRFAPEPGSEEGLGSAARYRGAVYGGDDIDRPISTEFRNYIHTLFMHALRDVDSDIRNWRRSPLRKLLLAAAARVDKDELEVVKAAMKTANKKMNDLTAIKQLSVAIEDRLLEMVGPNQAVETELAAAPDDPLRLIRSMRMFVDGDAHRGLSSASLGTLNVIYLALHELGLAPGMLDEAGLAHIVMAIEEPEAHLHPHLQRLIFRRLLDSGAHTQTTLVTTQSPYIASVADPKSLVVLRENDNASVAYAANDANLTEAEWEDISRYLDATRAELVFARRVLFVEGFAEQVLIPRLAETVDLNLDKLGITVCAIHGTHFLSYVRFCNALGIPWAVLTDGDPESSPEQTGIGRATILMNALGQAGTPSSSGIFLGSTTFEYDMLQDARNFTPCFSALKELCAPPSARTISDWGNSRPDHESFMRIIANAGGKGRYAQRLAKRTVLPPPYIQDALEYLCQL